MPIARTPLKFSVQYAEYPARQLDTQICKNWYGTIDNDGKFQTPMFPFPGTESWSTDAVSHSVRGMLSLNDVLYAVVDSQFRTYDANGGYKNIGILSTSVGRVFFIANDNQILCTDGINGYVYQLATTDTRTAGDFFTITSATTFIGPVVFSGSGFINDLTTSGTYTNSTSKKYKVQIDTVGSGDVADTFEWSDTDGVTWNAAGVAITQLSQILNDGIDISFIHKNGHNVGDAWEFEALADSAFYSPIIPAYLDTYGIYPQQNSKRFYLTQIDDFSEVSALDFAQANAWPDNLVAAISISQELTLLCQYTIEFWYDTGASIFPFQRRPNLLVHYGCAAPYSVAVGSNKTLFFLGQSKNGGVFIMTLVDYQATIISNEALNVKLKSLTTINDAFGYVIEWDGHTFYFITFPTEDLTYVYDYDLQRWYQRTTRRVNDILNGFQYVEGRYFANCHVYHKRMSLIGDYQSGNIYKLSRKSHYDRSLPIICEIITAPLNINLDRIGLHSLQVDFQAATSDLTGGIDDASIMLQYSKDGGISWSKELWRGVGETGESKRRIKWNLMTTSRVFVFRIRVSDPVYRVLLGAVVELEDVGQ